jgi:hypothetical protein
LDARSGNLKWKVVTTNPYRTYSVGYWLNMRGNDDWLAYAEKSGLLLTGKHNQMHAYRAEDGEELWHKTISGGQPVIITGENFINQSGHRFDIRTGDRLSKNALFARGGCNYAVANEHLIFLRDRSVAYVDLVGKHAHYLRNIRSGCSNSLVAADGVLSAPCFSVRCVCNYPIQTSFAMVHMPAAAQWAGTTSLKLAPIGK